VESPIPIRLALLILLMLSPLAWPIGDACAAAPLPPHALRAEPLDGPYRSLDRFCERARCRAGGFTENPLRNGPFLGYAEVVVEDEIDHRCLLALRTRTGWFLQPRAVTTLHLCSMTRAGLPACARLPVAEVSTELRAGPAPPPPDRGAPGLERPVRSRTLTRWHLRYHLRAGHLLDLEQAHPPVGFRRAALLGTRRLSFAD
jgi:hypothetical protein